MASTYDVIRDFDLPPGSEYVSTSPLWVLCVFRLKFPTTYSRSRQGSRSTAYSEAVEVRGPPMIITDDCLQLQVSTSKSSYITSLGATLIDSGINYLSEIFPGDYVLAWIVNNDSDYRSLVSRLSAFNDEGGQACNHFRDGLKFCGRVQSLRKKLSQGPDGQRSVRYTLQGTSFSEFDAQIFYEPHLAERTPQIGNYFGRLGTCLNELVADKARGIDVNKGIPFFLDLFFGRGVPPSLGRGNTDPRLRSTAGLEAPYSYILPGVIGQILGKNKTSSPGGIITYGDVLESVIGIQKYNPQETVSSSTSLIDASQKLNVDETIIAQRFAPDGTRGGGSRRFTDTPMLGEFLPQVPHFTNKPVWSILQQYLNPAVNEMYTCLRVNPDGLVVPTLTVRQLPFTSETLATDLAVTRFSSLPTWGIDPVLVKDVDVGRSDALRFNFIHVYGDAINDPAPYANQVVRNPPIRDDLDIARSGLRPHMQTIPCIGGDIRSGNPEKWMEINADILMGQQLTLTGIMTTVGIQAPICPGDNLEWDGVVFHIESVSHAAGIDYAGNKYFATTLALSHGVRSGFTFDDTSIYAGTQADDLTGFDPGQGRDTPQRIATTDRPGGDRLVAVNADANNDETLV